jgi:uncharacterized protein (TIGR02996 family)
MPSAEERAFFDRIRDEPAEDGPRLIYADWLEENGQPERAEFIRLQVALDKLPEDDPRRTDLRERERVLREANETRWAADLAPLVSGCEFRRGVIDSVSVDTNQFLTAGAAIFDVAPVRKVRFIDVGDRLAKLVQSPLLRNVRELDLSGNDTLENRGPILLGRSKQLVRLEALDLSFTELGDKGLQALANSPVFAALRSLYISGNGQAGGTARLGVPGLRALANSPHLSELSQLDVSGNYLSDTALRSLFEGPSARRLTRLALHGNRLGEAGTAALAASLVFTKMAELDGVIDLRRVEMGPAGTRVLAESPALKTVESLDLEGNFMGDAGLAALAASPHLKQLRVLSLRENRISDDGVRALARSPIMVTLRVVDLTGNVITQDSADRLSDASVEHHWRGLKLIVDSQLRTRPLAIGLLGGYFRRPLP